MKFSFKNISFAPFRKRALYFWIRHYRSFFVIFFLTLTGYAGYQWRHDLYRYRWSPEARKEYLEATVKETTFQERKFMDALDQIQRDRESQSKPPEGVKDLFAGARKKER